MSNKSSIEWLMIQLYEQGLLKGDGNKMDELLEQAKEMHKQEICKTYIDAIIDALRFPITLLDMSSEKYYNETFGK